MSTKKAKDDTNEPIVPEQETIIEDVRDQQIVNLTDALMRERADSVNLRRRQDEALAGVRKLSIVRVIRDLLPAIDNLERALKHVPADIKGHDYVKGVQSVVKQFEKAMDDLGIVRIKTVGERFDPLVHEAVSMEEGDGSQEIVSEELQSGYQLDDEVIRHAMVKVKLTD